MRKLLFFLTITAFVFLVGCSDSNSKGDKQDQVEKSNNVEEQMDTDKSSSIENDADSNSSSSENKDLSHAFANYMDEIMLLAPDEERVIGLYESVTGVNYVNDEILYNTLLDEVIPGYRQFIVDLEAIMPKNNEIRELHESYIEAANIQYNSFTLMVSALEEQNIDKITEANQGLDEARRILRNWLYSVEDLSKETGVGLE